MNYGSTSTVSDHTCDCRTAFAARTDVPAETATAVACAVPSDPTVDPLSRTTPGTELVIADHVLSSSAASDTSIVVPTWTHNVRPRAGNVESDTMTCPLSHTGPVAGAPIDVVGSDDAPPPPGVVVPEPVGAVVADEPVAAVVETMTAL
jgi:hypothetical protein